MATIHMHETTTATPEQFLAGITDFGPGRAKVFGRSADNYLKVHSLEADHADVTEGSAGVWERLNYDWSDPRRIVMTTTDSNVWGGASGHTYTLTPRPDGRTDIDVVVARRQERQGPTAGVRGRDVRQGRPSQGPRQNRQGDRSPQQSIPS